MSDGVKFDVSQIDALAKDLATKAPKQVVRAGRSVTVNEIKAVQDRAKANAPRDRPWLATQGIRRKTYVNKGNILGRAYTVPDPEGRPVGWFVEYGTSKMAPQPFMLPALTPSEQSYPAKIAEAIDLLGTADVGGPGGEEGD